MCICICVYIYIERERGVIVVPIHTTTTLKTINTIRGFSVGRYEKQQELQLLSIIALKPTNNVRGFRGRREPKGAYCLFVCVLYAD